MKSSGNTEDPRCRIPLWIVLASEDNPKACTGRRAIRYALAVEANERHHPPPGALLLDPYSSHPLSRKDAGAAMEKGVVAVDCSWNRLSSRGKYPAGGRWLAALKEKRRLPLVLAANPQHYGRLGELNTAEALGASVYVLCGRDAAEVFLNRFSFGRSFMELNGELLERYRGALDAKGIEEAERDWAGQA
jgi:pre-rRNA-processing protein TSR3